eukprot:4849665-Pleurochrysis_carterae.AAC.1
MRADELRARCAHRACDCAASSRRAFRHSRITARAPTEPPPPHGRSSWRDRRGRGRCEGRAAKKRSKRGVQEEEKRRAGTRGEHGERSASRRGGQKIRADRRHRTRGSKHWGVNTRHAQRRPEKANLVLAGA